MEFNFREYIRSLPIYQSWHKQLETKRLESMNNGAIESMDLLHSIFKKNSINYWLFAGTLLGFIRDGRPIPGDPDVDLGFWKADLELIERLVIKAGLVKIHEFSFDGVIYEQRYEFKGVGIDFFYFNKEAGLEYTYQFNRKIASFYPVKEVHYNNEFSSIVEKNFSGHTFNIPTQYEAILENTYGEWKTPLSREDGYQMFSAPIHIHLRHKNAKFKSFSKSVHQVNFLSFLIRYTLKKLIND